MEREMGQLNLYFLINSLAGGGAEKVLVRLLLYLRPEKVFLLEKDVHYPVDKGILEFISKHSVNW
jgi:hypothetical protein